MENHKLLTPVSLGKKHVVSLDLVALTAGSAIDAATDAEKVQITLTGEAVVVASPTLATAERVRRQVEKLYFGDGSSISGPMNLSDLRRLTEPDYIALINAIEIVDAAYLEREDPNSGRPETIAGNDTNGGGDQ